MVLNERGSGFVKCIKLVQDRIKWRAVMNTVMKFPVP